MERTDILVGRKAEQEHLRMIVESKEAEFVVVYGRRRIGKTFLINNFFNDQYTFKLTGIAKKDKKAQLSNFAEALNRYGDGSKYSKPRTWYEAFEMLRRLLESKRGEGKRIVFMDELPWLDTRGSNLVSALEHFWNDWAATQHDLVLIVCGSATSWITNKILKNRGGLHNRVTRKIYLHPFCLAEVKEYLTSRDILLDDMEMAECYMIMGGVPFYLKHIRRGRSLGQCIDEMFFTEKGSLDGEFDALFASLFEKSDAYVKVVEALSSRNRGLSREEILKATKLTSNGHFSKVLKDLIDCEFIRAYKGYGKSSQVGLYQLIDPFTFFHFKFIRKYGTCDSQFWQFQMGTHLHDTWKGLAFEQLCLNHHRQIGKQLGINGIVTNVFSWTSPSDADTKAQIDLIIKRSDRVVNLFEMKYYDGIYQMKRKDKEDMERRVQSFRNANAVRGAIHPILITSVGLKQNEYSGVFQGVITLKDLFEIR